MTATSKLTISLSFDDGSIYDIKLLDLLAKHSLTATFYIPYDWESYNHHRGYEPLTRDVLEQVADLHEIGSHTISHPLLTRISYGGAEYEITHSKKLLQDLIGKEVTKFAYPRGYASDPLLDIVRRTYEHGRSTLVGNTTKPLDPAWEHTSVHLACQRQEYGNEDWFKYALRHLELGQKQGYFHAWGHSAEIEKNNSWGAVDNFLARIKEVANASA